MRRAACSWALGTALFSLLALPAQSGGGGAVTITKTHGRVLICPADPHSGKQEGPWRPASRGDLVGTYLLRTGQRSWAHVSLPFAVRQGGQRRHLEGGCVDGGSLIRIDSYADSTIRVVRGKVTEVDGKRTGRLPDVMGWGTN